MRDSGHAGPELRLLALGRTSPAKGLDVVVRAVAEAGDGVRLDTHGPSLSDEERAHRADLERLVAGARARGSRPDRRCGSARRGPGAPREPRCARQQHARRCAGQGRVRGCGKLCARCSPRTRLRLAARSGAALRRATIPRRSPSGSASSRRSTRRRRAEIGRALRERVEARHSVQTWARGILAAAGLSA